MRALLTAVLTGLWFMVPPASAGPAAPAAIAPKVQKSWRPRGLSEAAWRDALAVKRCLTRHGATVQPDRVAVIDYSLPSTARRLWIVDLDDREVLVNALVAHGRRSGELYAEAFSNERGSNATSLGAYVGAETYHGKHGRSLRLDGLEPGFNDRARERAVVVHGADYATRGFADKVGRLGRSFGCPSVDPAISDEVIDLLRDGTLLVAWHPEASWHEDSELLHCGGDAAR